MGGALQNVEQAYNKHDARITEISKNTQKCQHEILGLSREIETINTQSKNLAQGLHAVQKENPEMIKQANQPAQQGLFNQVKLMFQKESESRSQQIQKVMLGHQLKFKEVFAAIHNAEAYARKAEALAQHAFNLVQRVEGATQQVGQELQQALSQVSGQILLQNQTTQSVATKLGLVEREILDQAKISVPVIPNVQVHIHNATPPVAKHHSSPVGGKLESLHRWGMTYGRLPL